MQLFGRHRHSHALSRHTPVFREETEIDRSVAWKKIICFPTLIGSAYNALGMRALHSVFQGMTRLLRATSSSSSSSTASQPWICEVVLLTLQQQRVGHFCTQPLHTSERKCLDPGLVAELTAAVDGKRSCSQAVLQQHGVDEGYQVRHTEAIYP